MIRNRELDDLVSQLAGRQHGAFTFAQLGAAASHRMASDRVSTGAWIRFLRGTYVLPDWCDEWTDHAAMCLHIAAATITGTAAGRWWGFDGLDAAPGELLVPPTCGVRHPLLRRCEDVLPWEIRSEGGCLRLTDPTRTLIELGRSLTLLSLEQAVESGLRTGLTSVPRLRARSAQLLRPGRSGPTAVLEVLDVRPIGGVADSDGEVLLLQLIRAAGLPHPHRQHRMGRWRFDLAWPELLVAVELDGGHHRSAEQLRIDDRKQNDTTLRGWTVLRFTWDRIAREPAAVAAEIAAALRARADGATRRVS